MIKEIIIFKEHLLHTLKVHVFLTPRIKK